jgi:tRNA (guanine-N7-)-methyltransferase
MSRLLKEFPEVTIPQDSIVGKLKFDEIFGRCAPVHFEIGSGKATFLVNEAKSKSGEDFFGVEWCNKIYRYAIDRVGRWGLKNVRLTRADAAVLIREHVADESIDCFHIYFPDPWPKKRHHKRRFLQEANVAELARCLKPGGMVKVATDHAEYFEQIQAVLKTPAFEPADFFPTSGAQADKGEWAGTNFERKYLKEGRPIYTIAVRKRVL